MRSTGWENQCHLTREKHLSGCFPHVCHTELVFPCHLLKAGVSEEREQDNGVMQCVRKARLEDPGEYSRNREKDKGTHYVGYPKVA